MTAAPNIPTRQRIVKTAMRLFHRQGYSATGIAQILEKSNVKSGSLYFLFDSKDQVLEAVLDEYKQCLKPAILDPITARTTDPIQRVFLLLKAYRDNLIRTGFKSGCPIGNLALEVADSHPQARKKVAENFEAWRLAVREFLDAAHDRFPVDFDRDKLATFILTTMEGAVMQARAYESIAPFDACIDMLKDYFGRLFAAADSVKTLLPSDGGST